MLVTILQASVMEEKANILEEEYRRAVQRLDPGILRTELVRSLKEPSTWQIITWWGSRQALEEMRQTGETPRGVLIFRAAGADPVVTIFEVIAEGKI